MRALVKSLPLPPEEDPESSPSPPHTTSAPDYEAIYNSPTGEAGEQKETSEKQNGLSGKHGDLQRPEANKISTPEEDEKSAPAISSVHQSQITQGVVLHVIQLYLVHRMGSLAIQYVRGGGHKVVPTIGMLIGHFFFCWSIFDLANGQASAWAGYDMYKRQCPTAERSTWFDFFLTLSLFSLLVQWCRLFFV